MSKISYVLGFAFDPQYRGVLLCVKNRPAWQAGKLNGLGGKIEEGETPFDAMVREFQEESGVLCRNWKHFGKRFRPDVYELHMFATTIHLSDLAKAAAFETDETNLLLPVNLDSINERGVAGLGWVVGLALEALKGTGCFFEMEDS